MLPKFADSIIILLILLVISKCMVFCFDAGFAFKSKSRDHVQLTECALYKITFDYLKQTDSNEPMLLAKFKWPSIQSGACPNARSQMRNLLFSLGHNTHLYFGALNEITNANRLVDLTDIFNGEAHFDNEMFARASQRVLGLGNAAQIAANENKFDSSREHFGRMLHTVQDFYAHSNWVELSAEQTNKKLGRSTDVGQVADIRTKTCKSCIDSEDSRKLCPNKFASFALKNNLLTSGYFSVKKPKGKCSHGGALDSSTKTRAIGTGINKDNLNAPRGKLHLKAARLASMSTIEMLEHFWTNIGSENFAKFLQLTPKTVLLAGDLSAKSSPHFQLAYSELNQHLNKKYSLKHSFSLLKPLSNHLRIDWKNAIRHAEPYSSIYVVTDLRNEHNLTEDLSALISRKNLDLNFLHAVKNASHLSSSLSKNDPNKRAVVFFKREEINALTESLVQSDILERKMSPVLIANLNNRSVWQTLTFYVDETCEKILVQLASSQTPLRFSIFDAQNRSIDESQYESILNSSYAQSFLINKSQSGLWRIEIAESSRDLHLKIMSDSSLLRDLEIELLKSNENSLHRGFAKAQVPVQNSDAHVFIRYGNKRMRNARLELLSKDSTLLREFAFQNNRQSVAFRVPSEEFRIKLIACFNKINNNNNNNKHCVQKTENKLYAPAKVDIKLLNPRLEMKLNQSYELAFQLRNFDAQNSCVFTLRIRDSLGLIDYSQHRMSLAQNHTKVERVLLRPNILLLDDVLDKHDLMTIYASPLYADSEWANFETFSVLITK